MPPRPQQSDDGLSLNTTNAYALPSQLHESHEACAIHAGAGWEQVLLPATRANRCSDRCAVHQPLADRCPLCPLPACLLTTDHRAS